MAAHFSVEWFRCGIEWSIEDEMKFFLMKLIKSCQNIYNQIKLLEMLTYCMNYNVDSMATSSATKE